MRHSLLNFFLPALVFCLALSLFSQFSWDLGIMTPITGQTLALLTGASIINLRSFLLGISLYFVLGIIGCPVFAEASSGWSTLTGPSLGYFIGFLVSGILASLLIYQNRKSNRFFSIYLIHIIGHFIILFLGFLFLFRYLSPSESFDQGIQPFLLPAVIKSLISAFLVFLYTRFF